MLVRFPNRRITAAVDVCAAFLTGYGRLTGQTRPVPQSDGWVSLLNGKNLDGWYTLLPCTGKNNDPKKVFNLENGMVHILDIPKTKEKQEFGYLSSEGDRDLQIKPLPPAKQ